MKIFGTHDENTLVQLHDVARGAARVALMADGHVGYVMPIGGVAAYRNQVSPIGVGVDIACGNAAIRTNLTADMVLPHREELGRHHRSPAHAVAAHRLHGTVTYG